MTGLLLTPCHACTGAPALQSIKDGHFSRADKQESQFVKCFCAAVCPVQGLHPSAMHRLNPPPIALHLHALEVQQGTSHTNVLHLHAGTQRIDWLFHKKPLFLMHWKDGKVPQEVQVGSCTFHKTSSPTCVPVPMLTGTLPACPSVHKFF